MKRSMSIKTGEHFHMISHTGHVQPLTMAANPPTNDPKAGPAQAENTLESKCQQASEAAREGQAERKGPEDDEG